MVLEGGEPALWAVGGPLLDLFAEGSLVTMQERAEGSEQSAEYRQREGMG